MAPDGAICFWGASEQEVVAVEVRQQNTLQRDDAARIRRQIKDAPGIALMNGTGLTQCRKAGQIARAKGDMVAPGLEIPHQIDAGFATEGEGSPVGRSTKGCQRATQSRQASPKASNSGRDTGSPAAFHSGCHCTDRVKPGASLT